MIGQAISHDKKLQKLRTGEMGVVYKARDTKLLRSIALTFLSPEDPNIAVVHDIDETTDGRSFVCASYHEAGMQAAALSKDPVAIDPAA
jgi:hypothetical protein